MLYSDTLQDTVLIYDPCNTKVDFICRSSGAVVCAS